MKRIVKILGIFMSAVVIATAFSVAEPEDVSAQTLEIYPVGGSYEPLTGSGLFSVLSGHMETTDPISQVVVQAAVYAGDGIEPMADTHAHASISTVNCDTSGYNWIYQNSGIAKIRGWPYRIGDSEGQPLETWEGEIPLKVDYRMDLLASGEDATAVGYFGIYVQESQMLAEAIRWQAVGEGKAPPGPDPASGTLSFTVWGTPILRMNVESSAEASASVKCGAGGCFSECIRPSSSSEARSLVDPFLYIDPASPLADEMHVLTLKAEGLPWDEPSSWVPATRTIITPISCDLTVGSTDGGSVTTPGEGEFTYDVGTAVGLLAEPDIGYQFVNWTGDVGTIADVNAASTTITMNGDYTITANFEPAWVHGDANGDGEIDATDISRVDRIIVGLDAPTPGADANLDGNINALDITRVERIIAGLD